MEEYPKMSLKVKGTQRIHNLLKSRLVQAIIHPLILITGLIITFLIIYKQICLKVNDALSYESVFGSNSSSSEFSVLSSDLTMGSAQLNFTTLLNVLPQSELRLIKNILEANQNQTIDQLEVFKSNTMNQIEEYLTDIQSLETNLTAEFNNDLERISENYSSLLSSLNSSIVLQLEEQQAVIASYKTELSDALYVGSSVNIDGLVLNISDIQSLFAEASSQNVVDELEVTSSYDIDIDDILDEINEIFNYAISQLEDLEFNGLSLSTTQFEFELSLNLDSTNYDSSNSSSTNSTIPTTSITSTTTSNMNKSLMVIGVSVILAYFLILLYEYFKFRYECNLRLQQFIDLEKNNSTDDYIQIIQNFDDVQVSMITELELRLVKEESKDMMRDKLFWLNDYLFGSNSNLSILGIFIALLVIFQLSISKTSASDSSSTSTASSSSSNVRIMKYYSLEVAGNYEGTNNYLNDKFQDFLESQAELSTNVTSNLTANLEDLFSKYDLNLTVPTITVTIFNTSTESSLDSIQTEINFITSSFEDLALEQKIIVSSTSSIHTNLIQKVLKIVFHMFFTITRLLVIILSILFLVIALFGCVYSFIV